jgi:hypothetical protein
MIEKTAHHAQNEYTMAAPSNTVNRGVQEQTAKMQQYTLIRQVEDVNCITFLLLYCIIFNVIQYQCSDNVSSYKDVDFLDFTFISNGPFRNIKSMFQIRMYKETTSNRIDRLY